MCHKTLTNLIKRKLFSFFWYRKPQTFISMLKINNFKDFKDIEFPDHYNYSKSDVDKIISISKIKIVKF